MASRLPGVKFVNLEPCSATDPMGCLKIETRSGNQTWRAELARPVFEMLRAAQATHHEERCVPVKIVPWPGPVRG
jgi:hypothetical protein